MWHSVCKDVKISWKGVRLYFIVYWQLLYTYSIFGWLTPIIIGYIPNNNINNEIDSSLLLNQN